MEAYPQRATEDEAGTVPERHRTRGKNKVERIGEQTKGLFQDLTEWVELRLKLFQLDIQEKIQKKLNEAVIKTAPFVAGSIAGLFALVTAALFIGRWLGHPAWGFLVVTGLLLLVTGILFAKSKSLDRKSGQEAEWSRSSNGSPDG